MSYKRTFQLFSISLITISSIVAVVMIAILASFEYKYERERLREIAQSRARLIESLAESGGYDEEEILSVLMKAHQKFKGFAQTGEYTLGKRENNSIIFLLNQHHYSDDRLERNPIPWNSRLAEPMQQALLGKSGTIIAHDYRGEKVIAAYEPIKILDWGVVAQIDVVEVRNNALANGFYLFLAIFILNLSTLILTKPIFQRLKASKLALLEKQRKQKKELEQQVIERTKELSQSEAQFRAIFENSAIGIILTDIEGKILQTNYTFQSLIDYKGNELNELNLQDLVEVDESNNYRPLDIASLTDIDNFDSIERLLISQNGQRLWAQLTIAIWNDTETQSKFLVIMVDDITKRKETEIAKEKLIRRNKSLIQSLGEIVYEHLVPEDIINWDGSYKDLLGYSSEEMGNDANSWLSKVHSDDLPHVKREFDRACRENHLYDLEYRFRHRNGHYLWFHDRGVMHVDSNDQLIQVIGVMRNITMRKEAENTIKETKETYETVLHETREGFLLVDLSGKFLEVNDAYCEMTGYSKQELLSMTVAELEVREDVEVVKKHMSKIIKDGNDLFETQHRCKDGSIVDLEINSSYINSHEKFFSFVRNITERKLAEKALEESRIKYQRLVDNIGDNFVIYSRLVEDGKFTYLSGGFENIFGIPVENAIGKSGDDIINWQEGEIEKARLYEEELLKGNVDIQQFEMNFIKPNGNLCIMRVTQHLSLDQDGNVMALEGIAEDVTQRKLAEIEVEESKIKYQRLVDNIGDNFVIYSYFPKNGIINYLSEGFESIFGIKLEDGINKSWMEIINWQPGEVEKAELYREKLLKDNNDEVQQFELNFLKPTGKIGTIMVTQHLCRDEQGNPIAIEGIVEDITDRKEAERALQESETKFRTFVNTAGAIIIIMSPEYKVLEWNQEAEKIYGYSREQMLGQDYSILCLLPEDREKVNGEVNKILAGEISISFEHDVLTKDGETRNILWVLSSFINSKGDIIGIAKVGQDITERKKAELALRKSEQKLRTLADFTYDWEYWLDPRGELIYITPSCERITGYSPESFYQDPQLLKRIIYHEDRELFHQHNCRGIDNNERSTIDFRIIDNNGDTRWIGHLCHLVYNQDGEWLGIRVSNRDITDRKEAEAKLQKTNKKLQLANQELQDWNKYLKEKNYEMQVLEQLNDFLPACLTLEEAYKAIPDLIKPLFPQSSGAIFVIDNSHNILNSVASWGNSHDIDKSFAHNDCWALRRGQLHFVDTEHSNLLCKHIDHQHPSLQSLCVPMMAQSETIGLLHIIGMVTDKQENTFTEQKQTLAKTIAEQLSLSIANLKLRETLQNQSIKDPLTGLFNRRYMEEFLTKEFYHAQRKKYSIGIMMLDIDHFKAFNDNFGHDAGDTVLREISIFLLDNIRGSDIACRYGGEELTLILPESDLENTKQRAENIREGIKKLQIKSQGQLLGVVTISIGIACFPQHGKMIQEVIQVADNALYQAKQSGRNQVKSPEDE